jgi:hypothetical protein
MNLNHIIECFIIFLCPLFQSSISLYLIYFFKYLKIIFDLFPAGHHRFHISFLFDLHINFKAHKLKCFAFFQNFELCYRNQSFHNLNFFLTRFRKFNQAQSDPKSSDLCSSLKAHHFPAASKPTSPINSFDHHL